MVLSIRTYWATSGQHSVTLFCYKTPLEAGTLMRMVFYHNGENNPLTLGLLCCSTSHLHVPVSSFLFIPRHMATDFIERKRGIGVRDEFDQSLSSLFLSCIRAGSQGTAAVL